MKPLRNADGEINTQVVVALIGAAATLLTALIAGAFGLIQLQASRAEPTAVPLAVEINGPAEVPLFTQRNFEIISDTAVRVEWTISGFGEDDINPFRDVDTVWIEPTDPGRVGESFTLIVTAFDSANNSSTARHRFQVVEEE